MKRHCSIALIALAATVGAAFGDVVHFDNPSGQFHWGTINTPGQFVDGQAYFDILQPPSQAGTTATPGTFSRFYRPWVTSGDYSEDYFAISVSPSLIRLAAADTVLVDHWWYGSHGTIPFDPPQVFLPGNSVGQDARFLTRVTTGGTVRNQDDQRVPFDLVETSDYYLGVNVSINLTPHYGWAHYVHGALTEWAYETEPNTAIQIPVIPCPGDWNNSGSVDSQDFFDFITAFFASNADFNHSGATDSQDFFDFITAFFQPC